RGEKRNGEGIVGMTWALFAAGVPSQVLSQWSVDDVGTAVLMQQFYANLNQKRMTKGAALRRAALSILHPGNRSSNRPRGTRNQSQAPPTGTVTAGRGEIVPLTPPFYDRCGVPIAAGRLVCDDCEAGPEPAFAWSQAVGQYTGALRTAIHRLKYDRKAALAVP